MGGVKCVSLRPEKERENICFFYTVPILYSFIYSPIERMGRSKEQQRVQSLFISFNTNLCTFYPLFFLWIFLRQNTIFRTFVGWKKTLKLDFGRLTYYPFFDALFRLVSKRSCFCLDN